MSFRTSLATLLTLVFAGSPVLLAQETEEDIVNRYLKRTEAKHTTKLSWFSVNFNVNRINRDNDYNSFASRESNYIQGANMSWLDMANAFGAECGVVFQERLAWRIGGEYWLKLGEEFSGTFTYTPPSGTPVSITNPKSEIQVYGGYTGVDYYVFNHPSALEHLTGLAVRIGGTIGYYEVKWDLWQEFQNLNLTTSQPTGVTTTYCGTAPGLTLDLGVDYPTGLFDLVAGVDMNYLYLNFANVAWYNSSDQEVVVSYDGTDAGRVDLNFSGIRGKIQLKRFFSW